jgi:aminoglycoside phosphotransferase (APT) family kinase protein
MRWLPEPTQSALTGALREAAPDLAELPIALRPVPAGQEPNWWSSSAVLGEEFVAKFAWSEPAARRIVHEGAVLAALTEATVPFIPTIVVATTNPALLVTRKVSGSSLFEVIDSIDRERAAEQLARFLVALHRPTTYEHRPYVQADTDAIRARIGQWIRPDQLGLVRDWCDWVDAIQAEPAPTVLVHGDLHGDNQVWQRDELRVVVDFETAGAAEPEFDLRAFPGTGPGVELLVATMRHYARLSGRELSTERAMGWHVRTALGDVLWRSAAGLHLPDRRTPEQWVEDLDARFAALGIEIGT